MEEMWRKAKRAIGNGICAHLLSIAARRRAPVAPSVKRLLAGLDGGAASMSAGERRQPALLRRSMSGVKSSKLLLFASERFPLRRAVVCDVERLDELSSTAQRPGKLAPPTSSLDQLMALFATNGLLHTDMIALSGFAAVEVCQEYDPREICMLMQPLMRQEYDPRYAIGGLAGAEDKDSFWHAAANEVKKAVKTFDVIQRFKVEADQTIFYSLLRALCTRNLFDTLRDAKNVLSKMVDEGFQPDVETYNSIIVPLCESFKLEEARKIMEDMKMKGIVPTISTYHAFLKQEGIDETLRLLKKMKEDGCGPMMTFLMLIDKFIQLNESGNALRVYNECAVELWVGVEGAFHVGRESVDEYYGGACFAETEMALRCVEEVGASLFTVKQALGSGCSYTPERGTFHIREHRECRSLTYGYHTPTSSSTLAKRRRPRLMYRRRVRQLLLGGGRS
ncbi:hypothetical protein ZWY2020_009981 [Hordeum vulgare]|nr:hypothetical protein ZWY2020_009981 [Hordeum vulgare]